MADRDALLVNYLAENEVWRDLIGVYEEVWGDQSDELARQLKDLRDLHRVDNRDEKAAAGQMLCMKDYSLFDRQTMVRICNMLGFTYPNVGDRLFSTEDYMRIAQNISDYYKEQGTDAFIRFFGYCLNARFELKATWTQDYITFVPEGSPEIGQPIWEGGTWYPTSHVQFFVDISKSGSINPDQFRDFFYYIAPINLVLLNTILKSEMTGQLYIAMAARMRVYQPSINPTLDRLRIAMAGRMRVNG